MSLEHPKPGLSDFYRRVDAVAGELGRRHAGRLNCRPGCAGCCIDGLTVFEVEAAHIAGRHAPLLESEAPHPPGACAFLDAGDSCRIYEDRPYVCRTQGLPLRWLEQDFDETVEYRDICPLNEAGEPVERLGPGECWTIGPFEEELARLQASRGSVDRVALRDLFKRK